MVLMIWDGSYDLTIITDASYTVQGMGAPARTKNGRGPNRDIWQLIYAELDSKQGGGILTITRAKQAPHRWSTDVLPWHPLWAYLGE